LTGRRSVACDFISLLAGPKFLALTTRKPTRAALRASPRMVDRLAVTACSAGFLRWCGPRTFAHYLWASAQSPNARQPLIKRAPSGSANGNSPPRCVAVRSELLHFSETPSLLSDNDRISIFDHDCGNERRRRRFLLLTLDALRKSSKIVPLGRAILRCLARNSCTYTPETWMGYVVDSP